jgi:hypothetical protein
MAGHYPPDLLPTENVRAMPLAALVAALRANTDAYFKGRSSDDRFAMELFRRAVLERSEEAWQAIHDTYLGLVTGWVRRHPAFAGSGEDSAYLANRAFERLWRVLGSDRLVNFPTLPSLLKYLKLCVHGAVVDAARSRGNVACDALDCFAVPSQGRGNVEQTEGLIHAEYLWNTVASVIGNPAQEHLAWDTLVLGMTPREVVAAHPENWSSVGQVYEAKASLLRRLRASRELAELRPSRLRPVAGRAS